MSEQLPAVFQPTALATPIDTHVVPALIAAAGDQAGWRYVEFFTANINNGHTRRAYARACGRFFAWCEHRGLTLLAIWPFDVAAWVNAAARGGAHAVRLAGHRPGRADEPGGGAECLGAACPQQATARVSGQGRGGNTISANRPSKGVS